MRVILAVVLLVAVAMLLSVQSAGAQVAFQPQSIGFPFVTTKDVFYTQPFYNIGFLATAVNTSTLTHSYTGALAISFTPIESSKSAGAMAAAPRIAQTVDESMACDRSWFFEDHSM